ncbi:AzlC family ABC transporter permease [Nisaea nitritireducens]|uniref:AzlC family ABC transporter permease n=1 Tax=Nisaea nitritireducens TaxID=568392 RepID=UPI001866CC61|nr:AzlC family ABC transporter permease [Nisaea nitritireducens]
MTTFTSAGMRTGAFLIWPIAVSGFFFAVAVGVISRNVGMTWLEAVTMSGFVFAGASQVAIIDLWQDPLPLLIIAITTLGINSRMLLMGASIREWFAPLPRHLTWISLFFLTDANWAVAISERRKGATDAGILLGSGIALWFSWVFGTGLGHALGAALDPKALAFDVLLPAFFVIMIKPIWTGRKQILPWLVAAAGAILANEFVPGEAHVVIGGIAGSLVGGLLRER